MATKKESLKERLRKSGSLAATYAKDAPEIKHGEGCPNEIPALNIAFRGCIDKGLSKGLTQFCGKSSTFKTLFALLAAKAYVDYWKAKGEEPAVFFYSNEHGATEEYFLSVGLDLEDIIYIPFVGISDLTHDVANRIEEINKGDRVFTIIDSIGMAGSKKETDDLLSNNEKVDMTRAKKLNTFARVVTPHLVPKELSMILINHIYVDQSVTYIKYIVSGGEKLYLASNKVWIIVAKQMTEDIKGKKEKIGKYFEILIDKSRFVRAYAKIPIGVRFDGGIIPYSGMFEIAVESGHIVQASKGFYSYSDEKFETKTPHKKLRRKEIESSDEFWEPILAEQEFKDYVYNRFALSGDLQKAKEIAEDRFEDDEIVIKSDVEK